MLSGLTYNIYHSTNLPAIRTWLTTDAKHYDILCFQEFIESKIAFLMDTKLFSQYDFRYAPSYKIGENVYGELTLVRKGALTITEDVIVELGTNFFEEKVMKMLWNRTSLVTRLEHKGKELLLANTHLIAYASNRQRREQLRMLFQELATFTTQKHHPVIVLGDMNYTSLLSRVKFFEIVRQEGYTNAYNIHTHKLLALKYQQLDYIFYKACTVENIKVLKKPFSDHLPVEFQIDL